MLVPESTAPVHTKTLLAKVVTFTWKSEGSLEDSKWMHVSLSEPGADEECPITQELMSSPQSGLDFLPETTYVEDCPSYRRMELGCGHAFSALPLTYHFFRSGMQCPLCRAGHPDTLSAMCIPVHFRKAMQTRLTADRTQDRLEADRENMAAAVLAAQEGVASIMEGLEGAGSINLILERIRMVAPFNILEANLPPGLVENNASLAEFSPEINAGRLSYFFAHHRIRLLVYAYEPGEVTVPAAVLEFPMDVWTTQELGEPENRLNAMLSRASLRDLARNLRTLEQPIRYVFVVGTRSVGGAVIEIARSVMVDPGDRTQTTLANRTLSVACNVPNSNFEVRRLQGTQANAIELERLSWGIPERLFLSTVMARITQTHEAQLRVSARAPAETIVIID